MPYSKDDNYDKYFLSSIKELAGKLQGAISAPLLVIYNSDLDIPIEYEYEDYTMYCNSEQIEDVIKRVENTDSFATLIIHGFDISLDDVREKYNAIARRNNAHLCINVLSEYEINSNLSLYLDENIDREPDSNWEEAKVEIQKQIDEFIDGYDADFDLDEDEAAIFNEFLNSLYDGLFDKEEKEGDDEGEKDLFMPIPLFPLSLKGGLFENDDEEEKKDEDVIAFTYQNRKDFISISCLDGELYIIDDDECEILLTEDQMEFLIESYNKIKKNNK
jgi:hypothetical protein